MVYKDKPRAIVLAAGKGVRMGSDRPKVLHSLLGRPMIHRVFDSLSQAGIDDLYAVVGPDHETSSWKLEQDVRFVVQAEALGTGHAVAACREAFGDWQGPVVVTCGDAPLIPASVFEDMLNLQAQTGASCVLLTAVLEDAEGYGRVLRDASGRFSRIVEDAEADEAEREILEINTGAFCLKAPEVFSVLEQVEKKGEKGEIYLPEAARLLAEAGKGVETVQLEDPLLGASINTRWDLVACNNQLRWRVVEELMSAGVTVVDPSTTYIEDGVEIGRDTIVEPFTVIRRGVKVGTGCHVGPFSQLRSGTVLEPGAEVGNFVETKNTVIGSGSKAKHLSYLGDARLGKKVNIGAGTITANYDGKNKHKTVLKDGVHSGSNSVFVAPVTVGQGVKIGAGAVVVGGEVPDGSTVVGVPARPLGQSVKQASKSKNCIRQGEEE